MKRVKHTLLYLLAAGAMLLTGCSDDFFGDKTEQHDSNRIQLSGDIDQLAVTRVNDNGFCNGDVMGVYIVDYEGNKPGTLKVNGNRGDNVRHTFDEPNYKWNSAYDLFWKDKHTHIDVYGYYPFANPESIEDYQFEVQKDQSKATENGEMGGYEASDFLWGKVSDVAPTTSVIRLPMAHRMSNARVTLIQGSGFAEGEWANLEKIVLTANVARKASINLSTGDIKTAGAVENTMTIPSRTNDEWRTIVVPQTVAAGTTLFSITISGVPYKFTKNEAFTYVSGKMMNFGIKVDKQTGSGAYKLTLVSESITPWENDQVSHDATAKEYIVINSTAGHLKEAIAAANKDYTKIKNLKITGEINAQDFYFMRDSMENLAALNLKEVIIRGGEQRLTGGFETVEALAVVDILRRADIKTDMISITGDINVKSAQGVIVQADVLLDEYVFEGDELLFLPGGPGHKSYYDCKDLLELLKEYNKKNNRIAAICAAPSILGNLGLLEGKKAMAFPGFETQLTGAVIITAPERVVTDGNITTSRGMGTSLDLGLELVRLIKGEELAEQLRASTQYI